MHRCAPLCGTRLFAVEVSGWDCADNFFVEGCDLVWNEDTGRHVVLNRSLRENAVLFVRLREAEMVDRSHPIVYEAQLMGRTPGGQRQFHLTTVVPRVKEPTGPAS